MASSIKSLGFDDSEPLECRGSIVVVSGGISAGRSTEGSRDTRDKKEFAGLCEISVATLRNVPSTPALARKRRI